MKVLKKLRLSEIEPATSGYLAHCSTTALPDVVLGLRGHPRGDGGDDAGQVHQHHTLQPGTLND